MKISATPNHSKLSFWRRRLLNIDWKEIRALNGSQQNGFEELCSQIARSEIHPGANFVRNGTPDGGVECYAILPDKNEWGWQAKYFDILGESQWGQLDKSVKTALEKHPKLCRYYICIPLDLPDARIGYQQSARQKWDNHVEKWTGWASDLDMNVEFMYWGSSELLSFLAEPKNLGLVRFWFDKRIFDKEWFKSRFEEARKTAGPRYTPEINVQMPITDDFEAFGRTVHFFNELKSHALDIRDKLRSFKYIGSEKEIEAPESASLISEIISLTEYILSELSSIKEQPIGELPFLKIHNQIIVANTSIEKLDKLLYEREREYDTKQSNQKDTKKESAYRINPFQEKRYKLTALHQVLRDLCDSLENANRLASNSLLLLTGDAGTGKTHLLCDIANRRIKEGYPTILLMGQRFISESEPWTQLFQQLDLPGLSAEEFVSTLEVAAKTAGCRALVIVDALNEGAGRRIWPNNLNAFLARLQSSPWIGIILSVRSSYEELIISEEIRKNAARIKHYGFAENEYDAVRTFFLYYGLDLPSAPLLAPEFSNPLFLKTLCQGLKENGNCRLPRGLHGITTMFELFLSAINNKLARELSFNPKIPLVKRALNKFTRTLIDTEERWLSIDKAEEIINELLPGKDFYHSLFYGLVSEGILIVEAAWGKNTPEDVVFITYERFADHLIASSLINMHIDPQSPETAFFEGKPLSIICNPQRYVPPGLLEALCLQIPERTGRELIEIAPAVKDRWDIGKAFRDSLIWRAPHAFSDATLDSLNKLILTEYDFKDTIEVILTVATIPGHPFNAIFLDRRLHKDTMPDRDAWWSTYLHERWKTHGAVDRLIDWAFTVTQQDVFDSETIDLCSIVLAWILTVSNRFLRDHATKALVILLTGRLDAVLRLVERFADVDDLYITERIYAVAYGVAMRSYDREKIGSLAISVYRQVFEAGTPPVHILLRDYARGVIERALYLGSKIDINEDKIRSPYRSSWPTIPTENDLKPLLPDWSRGSHDSRDLEWARNRIGGSVMGDDFARYVIGTDIGHKDFLSLKLDEPQWQSPDERLILLISDFSEEELIAWKDFDDASKELEKVMPTVIERLFKKLKLDTGDEVIDLVNIAEIANESKESHPENIKRIEEERDRKLTVLRTSLTESHLMDLEEIFCDIENEKKRPPYFDLKLIQHYILWRVFNLGWTIKRFGYFDRFMIGYYGRDASKAERIGKKYQWIAYHEIMALIADHFQYYDEYNRNNSGRKYDGPWQLNLRDIDPSYTLKPKISEGRDTHLLASWDSARYENWNSPQDQLEWAKFYDDLPKIEDLLSVKSPMDGSSWLNLHGFFNWKQLPPVDKDSTDTERRELWYRSTGYLIKDSDTEFFISHAEKVDFLGRMMSQPPDIYGIFLGEYGWSPAWNNFNNEYLSSEEWRLLDKDCPVRVRTVSFCYHCKPSGFDCSVDDSCTLILPEDRIVSGLRLRWSGNNSDFFDETGQIIAFGSTAHSEGPSALLIRQDKLKEFLAHEKLALCWIVTGEKLAHGPGYTPRNYAALRMSGAYVLGPDGPTGFLNCFLESRDKEDHERSVVPLVTLRTA